MSEMNLILKKDANNRCYFVIKIHYMIAEVVSCSYERMEELYKALEDLEKGNFVIEEHFACFYFTVLNNHHQIICTSSNFETYKLCVSVIERFKHILKKDKLELLNLCDDLPN